MIEMTRKKKRASGLAPLCIAIKKLIGGVRSSKCLRVFGKNIEFSSMTGCILFLSIIASCKPIIHNPEKVNRLKHCRTHGNLRCVRLYLKFV